MTAKTSVIYRPFMNLEVRQDIDDMTYNITDLAKIYFKSTGKRKDVSKYMANQQTLDYISLLRTVETQKVVSKIKRWKYQWTWVCQELLVDFMMWVSPEFKHIAIQFIIDWVNLAWKRNTLKEWYKKMTRAILGSWNANYKEEAKLINVLVTWSGASNQRSRLEIDEMEQMDNLQTMNAWLIKAWLPLKQRKDILIKSL